MGDFLSSVARVALEIFLDELRQPNVIVFEDDQLVQSKQNVLISGRGGAGWAKYGCPLHQNRGMCANELVVLRDRIEQELISALQREVLREDVAAFALEEFKRQLRARLEDTRSHLATMRNKREKLKTEIANLARDCGWAQIDPAARGVGEAREGTRLYQRRTPRG